MRERVQGWRRLRWFTAPLLAMLASPAAAEFMPKPDQIASPAEKPILSETLLKFLYAPASKSEDALRTLDDALARLSQPTPFRGVVQFARVAALIEGKKEAQAREAVEESIRLLPEYSGPLFAGSHLYAYSDQPGWAADYLLRASRIDPEIVARAPEYEIDNIMRRLAFAEDHRRLRTLSARLLEVGWKSESLTAQSALVSRAIEARMAEDEVQGAAAFVPKLVSPGDSRALLVQNRYRALWPDIERWAGPKLETQWKAYLAESRSRWDASKSASNARAYVAALIAAGHDETLIRTFLPIFSKPLDAARDYEFIYVVSPVANALARKGRWDDIDALYEQASKIWPLGKDANAINLSANRARQLFERDRPKDGLIAMDAALADAARWKEINGDAIAAMHHYRACMLHALGRDTEAALSLAASGTERNPVARAGQLLCFGRHDAAREVLIAALTDEEARDDVLMFVQPSENPPMVSAHGLAIHARYQALRSDPKLLAATAEHGRILPFSLTDGAPPELPIGGTVKR